MSNGAIEIVIPATGGPASVKLPHQTETVQISPTALGAILSKVEDRTRVAEWHDYLQSHGLAVLKQESGQLCQVLSLPRMSRRIRFSITDMHQPHDMVLQYPPLVAIHAWQHGRYVIDWSRLMVSQTRVGAITDPALLYTFPWGNVRHPTGVPCWGSVPTHTLQSADPTGALDVFFRAPFNNHIMAHDLSGARDGAGRAYSTDIDFDEDEGNYDHPGLGTRFLHWAQEQPHFPGTMENPIVLPFPRAHNRYRGPAKTLAQLLLEIPAAH